MHVSSVPLEIEQTIPGNRGSTIHSKLSRSGLLECATNDAIGLSWLNLTCTLTSYDNVVVQCSLRKAKRDSKNNWTVFC